MKRIFFFTLVFFSLNSHAANMVFEMKLTGKNGHPPPATTDLGFRQMIGDMIAHNDVKEFKLIENYTGGGFHACVEALDTAGYNDIIYHLQAISAGSEALWDVQIVKTCTIDPLLIGP